MSIFTRQKKRHWHESYVVKEFLSTADTTTRWRFISLPKDIGKLTETKNFLLRINRVVPPVKLPALHRRLGWFNTYKVFYYAWLEKKFVFCELF